MRWALALLVVLAASSAMPGTVAAGGGVTQTSFAFGRTGGNIEPFTVTISR